MVVVISIVTSTMIAVPPSIPTVLIVASEIAPVKSRIVTVAIAVGIVVITRPSSEISSTSGTTTDQDRTTENGQKIDGFHQTN